MISKMGILVAITALAALLLTSPALAGNSWICSITDAVAIDEDGTIGPPDLGGINPPTFLRVDADNMRITLLSPEDRRGEITPIDAVHRGEALWVFSGVEDLRAWSLVISETGHLSLSVTTDGSVWSVFGSALLED